LLFCSDIIYFQTYSASFNTCFLALLGDFGWYTSLTEQIEPLASGIWWVVPAIWFWTFMIFALLILLNMLLAIIMSNYDQVMREVQMMPDAPTLLQQSSRYLQRRRKARKLGFRPLENFLVELNDDDDPAHPDEIVTEDSLKGLKGMSDDQANFLMNWLQKDSNALAAKTEPDPMVKMLQQVMTFNSTIASNVHVVSLNVLRNNRQLERIESKLGGAFGSDASVKEDNGKPVPQAQHSSLSLSTQQPSFSTQQPSFSATSEQVPLLSPATSPMAARSPMGADALMPRSNSTQLAYQNSSEQPPTAQILWQLLKEQNEQLREQATFLNGLSKSMDDLKKIGRRLAKERGGERDASAFARDNASGR
jgi:hypothetical protein